MEQPRSRAGRRLGRRLLLAGLVIWVVLLGLVAADLISSRRALEAGLTDIRLAKAGITTAGLERDPLSTIDRARTRLASAQSNFVTADTRLSPLGPFLDHLSWVPRFGQDLAGAVPAARLARRSTDGALALIDGLQPLRARMAARGGSNASLPVSRLVGALAAGRGDFRRACADFSDAEVARQTLGASTSAQIRDAVRSFDKDAPRLRLACRTLAALPRLLGYRRQYTYMLAYQDPLQIRATGGFLGTAGLLTVRGGRASQRFVSTWLHDNLSVPPPEPMQVYDNEPGWLFRDSNWSPDFPTTAALERFFARLDLGWRAPAVIDLTPRVVADTLSVLGPFYSPEYHRTIDGGNVTQLTDYYTHHAKGFFGPLAIKNAATRRKQFIQIVASHIFARLHTLRPAVLVRLADRLARDVQTGDLLMNFRSPALQNMLKMAGATGRVKRAGGDYLFVVDSNLSYNKINPLVHLNVGYRAHIQSNRWISSDLTLRFRNVRGPRSAYDEAEGPGAGASGAPEDYADFVRVYVPAGAALQRESGWTQPWSPGQAYSREMFSGYLVVPVGQSRTVRLHYLIPPNAFSWSHGRRYRLVIQHQPGSTIDTFRAAADDAGREVAVKTVTHPDTDWELTGRIRRLPFHPLHLSDIIPTVVAPGRWIEPHAFLGRPRTS